MRANVALEEFADREHMGFLIERGCACEARGVRPTQNLRQIDDQASLAVLDVLDAESGPQRATPLPPYALNRASHEQSDQVATGVIKALGQRDISPPDIVSVIGQLFETAAQETTRRSDPPELCGTKCAALTLAANGDSTEVRHLFMTAPGDTDENVSQKAHHTLNQPVLRQIG